MCHANRILLMMTVVGGWDIFVELKLLRQTSQRSRLLLLQFCCCYCYHFFYRHLLTQTVSGWGDIHGAELHNYSNIKITIVFVIVVVVIVILIVFDTNRRWMGRYSWSIIVQLFPQTSPRSRMFCVIVVVAVVAIVIDTNCRWMGRYSWSRIAQRFLQTSPRSRWLPVASTWLRYWFVFGMSYSGICVVFHQDQCIVWVTSQKLLLN